MESPVTTPSPSIGKIGPYTVFLTPPTTTNPNSATTAANSAAPDTVVIQPQPPVQPPPVQFDKPDNDRFAFIRDALTKFQNVHANVDAFVAHWLGLNQSKFQWALDDFYEAQGIGKGDAAKEVLSKSQAV